MLPVSLFGMSISAAELPAMSSALGTDEQVAATLRQRIAASTKRVGFFVVPSAVGFIALGDVITAAIYQTGKFTHADAIRVWGILAGWALGWWLRRSAGCIPQLITRCAIRARR